MHPVGFETRRGEGRRYRRLTRTWAVVAFLAVPACTRFQSSSSCVADACGADEPACRFYDFATGCPPEWKFEGDPENGDLVVHRCDNGKIHIVAKNTLDADAKLMVDTPKTAWAVAISAKVVVDAWDSERMLGIMFGDTVIAEIHAVMAPSGNPRFSFCDSPTSCNETVDGVKGAELDVAFDLSPTKGVSVSLNCETLATRPPPASFPIGGTLTFVFGKIDGDPIDATLDDVGIRFRDPP